MRTVFIETSALNFFYKRGISGSQLNTIVKGKGMEPIVGMYTIYELARTFFNAWQLLSMENVFSLSLGAKVL